MEWEAFSYMLYFFLGGAKGHVQYCHVLTDYPGKKVTDGSICQLVYILLDKANSTGFQYG